MNKETVAKRAFCTRLFFLTFHCQYFVIFRNFTINILCFDRFRGNAVVLC